VRDVRIDHHLSRVYCRMSRQSQARPSDQVSTCLDLIFHLLRARALFWSHWPNDPPDHPDEKQSFWQNEAFFVHVRLFLANRRPHVNLKHEPELASHVNLPSEPPRKRGQAYQFIKQRRWPGQRVLIE